MAAQNLSELLSKKYFRIPDYQRGYAWEEKQLIDLWDDVDEISEENGGYKQHYAGTIYLEESEPAENEKWLYNSKFYHVVDGQQRLTTISIFLFEIIKLAENGHGESNKKELTKEYLYIENQTGNTKAYKLDYYILNKNRAYLINNIFEDNTAVPDNSNLNIYTKNLNYAKEFFSNRLKVLNHEEREIIFKKLTSSLQFDIRMIERDLDVQGVFETMNNRGKPLSILEKLKNRLIYLTEKLNVPKEDKIKLRGCINEALGKIYTKLAENPIMYLDEDEFLSAHLSLYRKPKEAVYSEKLAEEKVFKMFCNKSDKYEDEEGVSYSKIHNYIIDLSRAAPVWYRIHKPELPIIQKILFLNGTKEIKVFLLALLLNENEICCSNDILINIEKILFRNKIPGITIMDERNFAAWGREIYLKEDDSNKIINKTNNLIQTQISVQSLIGSIQNLFTYERGNKGFHRWSYLKYFLFEYENYLKNSFKETNDKISLGDYESTTIEHIIPGKWEDNWNDIVKEFTQEIDDDKKERSRIVLLNTLGNLTILKDGKNSSLGNKGWEEKKERFSVGSYNEIDISKNNNWSKKEIYERGMKMLDFLKIKVDGLALSDDEKKKILFFDDFIIEKFIN